MTYTAEELAQHMENDCMLVGWDDVPAMLRSQATEIARLRETLSEFAALLPGPYYMDPPDGGSVTVLEQFRRMALDAQRWRSSQFE